MAYSIPPADSRSDLSFRDNTIDENKSSNIDNQDIDQTTAKLYIESSETEIDLSKEKKLKEKSIELLSPRHTKLTLNIYLTRIPDVLHKNEIGIHCDYISDKLFKLFTQEFNQSSIIQDCCNDALYNTRVSDISLSADEIYDNVINHMMGTASIALDNLIIENQNLTKEIKFIKEKINNEENEEQIIILQEQLKTLIAKIQPPELNMNMNMNNIVSQVDHTIALLFGLSKTSTGKGLLVTTARLNQDTLIKQEINNLKISNPSLATNIKTKVDNLLNPILLKELDNLVDIFITKNSILTVEGELCSINMIQEKTIDIFKEIILEKRNVTLPDKEDESVKLQRIKKSQKSNKWKDFVPFFHKKESTLATLDENTKTFTLYLNEVWQNITPNNKNSIAQQHVLYSQSNYCLSLIDSWVENSLITLEESELIINKLKKQHNIDLSFTDSGLLRLLLNKYLLNHKNSHVPQDERKKILSFITDFIINEKQPIIVTKEELYKIVQKECCNIIGESRWELFPHK